ncbi:glucose-6-phosphate isomerase [Actinocorallia sp. A-T 12471]|uniref:glucose-6-phosphate isomerase n=1 Tax=Actinocorallia sp. A-T 12471 TaxID=3089813 RepID=UPI0029D39E5B|nr:glucose-6-phosphate isomerase [Actinocorallia sp. A-T 12471]MDX6740563.1 glucose-6-phosphate isomerase [Actinocorallia sp. A-T 12471]
MTTVVTAAAGVSVTVRGDAVEETETVLQRLASDGVPAALAAKSAQLWGPDAVEEASRRLGWLDLPQTSRALVEPLARLAEEYRAEGLDRFVLAGMGGSSLASEVVSRTAGVELAVLDGTDPRQVARTVADRLARTVVVVASKSGGTIETDSHRRVFEHAFREAGITGDALRRRFVVITDPGSPLENSARQAGYHVILSDPDVGGRYSALSAFGLVPSGLAGADVGTLLDEAAALAPSLRQPYDNPALALGAALGTAASAGRDKLLIADGGSGVSGFAEWAEQLVAESTGKEGKGILPVVVEGVEAPGFAPAPDVRGVVLGDYESAALTVKGPLGAQFLLWEYATAVAGRVIGVNPFDQPDVQESKDRTGAVLAAYETEGEAALDDGAPDFVEGAVEVHAGGAFAVPPASLTEALDALLGAVPDRGYLAVMAYLDPAGDDAEAAGLRALLTLRAERLGLPPAPVTFGWGPRFLHSTGQYHKGGPRNGVYLQLTGTAPLDVPIPGRPYTFRTLQLAQAAGDLRALRSRGRPAVRLHLRDRAEGLAQLLDALKN